MPRWSFWTLCGPTSRAPTFGRLPSSTRRATAVSVAPSTPPTPRLERMTTTSASATPSAALQDAIAQFDPGAARGYLGAASIGIPTRETVEAQLADLEAWRTARLSPADYDGAVARTRSHFASLVGVQPERVAIGSQTSAIVSMLASAVPAGAEVLCVDGDFSSVVFPFLQRPDVRVRSVPLTALASEITEQTWLVSFSFAQSATGEIADIGAICEDRKSVV